MYIRKMTFSIIIQIVQLVEGNIENFHPEKNHCQPRLTPRLTIILVFLGVKIYASVDNGFSRGENFQYYPQLHELFIYYYIFSLISM
jgi:hypothetical protein